MEQQAVIRSKATAGEGKPAGAVSSVFDTGTPEKPKRQLAPVDLGQLQIERGVPLPAARSGTESPWPQVYARMNKGDMVRLTSRQATSFQSWGKKHKAPLTRRSLGPDSAGVWRTE